MCAFANVKHRTIEVAASSVERASISLSAGRVSMIGVAAGAPPGVRVERPRRRRRNDSRSVFLNDLRRDSTSPEPLKSAGGERAPRLEKLYNE